MTARSELTLNEVVDKYPNFPKLIILKTDIQRRGVYYTPKALEAVDITKHHLGGTDIFGIRDGKLRYRPESFTLRDGTSVLSTPTPLENSPYIVDLIDGKLVLVDKGEILEEVFYWEKPDYYDKKTSSGVLMQNVVGSRPQRLYLIPNRYCHFWTDNQGCKFCDIVNNLKQQKNEINMQTRISPKDVSETIKEALKEKGRFSAICLTAGSDFHGEIPFDKEIDYYIEVLQAIGENFATDKFPSQLICTAVTKEQLKRLYENTGLLSLTMDIEVLNENAFKYVCPGKAKWIGYKEWKRRLIDAVEIFGKSRVNTGIVSGVELVGEFGFKSEDEALEGVLQEADELAGYGVSTVNMVWIPRPNSYFANEKNASLEYYVRLAHGLQEIRKKYNLKIDFDDYRRCGNHPDSDLARVF
jgi:biotin synthase-related radical SAM superfamily protein